MQKNRGDILKKMVFQYFYDLMLSSFVWVSFDTSTQVLTSQLQNIYIPYHCQFLVIVPKMGEHYQVNEIYSTKNGSKTFINHFGSWSPEEKLILDPEEFYRRRSNMFGTRLIIRILNEVIDLIGL